MNKRVSTVGSYMILADIRDCDGTQVAPSQVSDVKIKISEYLNPSAIVDGYSLYSLGVSGMKSTPETDENGFEYNFAFNPYHDQKPMFPKHGTTYLVELVWYDTNGNPYTGAQYVDSM